LNDDSLNRGFVLLANDDPELTDDYSTTKMSKDQRKKNEQEKNTHYLKRQNTLLKEWEVRLEIFMIKKKYRKSLFKKNKTSFDLRSCD
jgi:hypothetical protein